MKADRAKIELEKSIHSKSTDVEKFVDKVVSFRFLNKLDWNNCCTFLLHKYVCVSSASWCENSWIGRKSGFVAQEAPPWSVSTTAAYHAAFVANDFVSAGDFDNQ